MAVLRGVSAALAWVYLAALAFQTARLATEKARAQPRLSPGH